MAEGGNQRSRCREHREVVVGLVESAWRDMEPGEPRKGSRGPWGGLRMPFKFSGRRNKKMGTYGTVEEPGGEAEKQGVACSALVAGATIAHARYPA